VKDELREGDQVLVKVLGIEGNRIKLSRKALLKEQRQKLGLPEPGQVSAVAARGDDERRPQRSERPERGERTERTERPDRPERTPERTVERQPASNASTITIEGGDEFEDGDDDVEGEEPNFNRADDAQPVTAGQPGGAGQGDAARRRRRRGRGRGPGGPGGSGSGGGNRR
jgi:polyribonucleotide nucleotidyltransferase